MLAPVASNDEESPNSGSDLKKSYDEGGRRNTYLHCHLCVHNYYHTHTLWF